MPIPIVADAVRILISLSCLGQQFAILDPKWVSGEYIAASLINAGADVCAAGALLRKQYLLRSGDLDRYISPHHDAQAYPLVRKMRFNEINSGDIILWAISVVELLESTTGSGAPCDGGDFKAGADQFSTVYGQLGSAFPNGGWQGLASQAYAGENADQRDRVRTMADLDRALAAVVKNQADCITHIRLSFGILKSLLDGALIIARFMWAINQDMAKRFRIIVAVVGVALAIGMVATVSGISEANKKEADGLAAKYRG